MKQEQNRERNHERETHLSVLEDLSVVNALLILVLSLVFLIDIARYQWVLFIVLLLGIVLNLSITLRGLLSRQWFLWVPAFLLTIGLLTGVVILLY